MISKYGGRMFACDTHSDNMTGVVSGHKGTHVFTLTTCQLLFSIPRGCFWVCFMELSNRLAYAGSFNSIPFILDTTKKA